MADEFYKARGFDKAVACIETKWAADAEDKYTPTCATGPIQEVEWFNAKQEDGNAEFTAKLVTRFGTHSRT